MIAIMIVCNCDSDHCSINHDDDGMSQHVNSDKKAVTMTAELEPQCKLSTVPSLLPSTRKSSSKLCYLIWAFCAMYAASRDLVGRLCKHSVTGSTHVYLLKHQSHTEAVKETRRRLTAQRTQRERTCGITFKCNQSSANQTVK